MSGRLMGLDPGERRIGVALSDELGLLASPLCILNRRSWVADVASLADLVRTHDVVEVVVGHPKTLRGEIGPQARRAERFAEALRRAVNVPVRLWDERYSTTEASELLARSGKRAAGRRGAPLRVDAAAAAVILQGFLDARRSSGSSPS
ncbi:MAG: Holliday junction resolvase RuvX [Chloroflexota bacterium]|nr:Holliday junction resolvase RuvX [Chloroflexota bacterium]